jgi:hypothetical protein
MYNERKSLYIETTIPSYITGRLSRDLIIAGRQALTKLFWDTQRQKYDLFVSQYVMDEISNGDPDAAAERLKCVVGITVLPKSAEIDNLAAAYKELLEIPDRAATDCNHVATCVVEHLDYLMTWNCTHMGPDAQIKLQDYNREHGLWTPALVTPEALMPVNTSEEGII